MNEVVSISERIAEVGDVIRVLQIERGLTVNFIASNGTSGANELRASRTEADQHRFELIELLNSWTNREDRIGEMSRSLLKHLDTLDDGRASVDSLKMNSSESFEFYTRTLNELIRFSIELSATGTSSSIAGEIFSYNLLMQAKENLGQDR